MRNTKISILIAVLLMSLFACIGIQAEFTESVDTVMTVRSANGEEIGSPEELSAGEYNVILNIGNLTHEAKKVEVYVAVKVSGKLYSVKSRTTDLGNKDLMQVYPIEIPVTLAKDVSGKEISIEAYCWDDTMVPFNRKTVFGDAKTEIYTAYGRITATSRSNGNLDYGEVKFCVEKSNNFDGVEYGSSSWAGYAEFSMYYANEEAYKEMFRYSKATIIKDVETEDFTIVSLEYMDSESTVITECSLYEIGSATYDEISFYTDSESSTTNTYDISTNARVYVNGVGVTWSTGSWLDALAYIESNDSGKVTLIDVTEIGKTTTDGKIDYIFVDYYVDGIVDSVVDGEEYKIYFENGHVDIKTLKVDTTDEDMYTRYILDGEEISHTDLQSGDVLSIAYDVTGSFSDSAFYDVLVSRGVVNGKVMSTGEDNNECPYYVINDQKYSASKLGPVASDTLTTGNDYILWLNAFGFFVKYDEDITNKNIGIFDMAYIDSNDVPKIRLITKDGEKVSYAVNDNSKAKYYEIASNFYDGNVGGTLKTIENLICEYNVNSIGCITDVVPLNDVTYISGETNVYRSSTNKLGRYLLNENTKIIDLTDESNSLTAANYDISKINLIKISDLISGNEYEAIFAQRVSSDNSYRYVVLLEGETGYVEPEDVITSHTGIFDRAYIDSSNNATIRVINETGEKVSYTVKNNNTTLYTQIASQFYSNGIGSALKSIENLVCEYSINSKGYIVSAIPLEDTQISSVSEYEAGANKIGQYMFDEDTVILDLTDAVNDIMNGTIYKVNSIKSTDLINGEYYDFLVSDMKEDGTYRYIVLLVGNTGYVEPEDETVSYVGVFDKAYIDSGDIPWIRLITKDGEKKVYPVKYDNKTLYMEMASQFYTGEVGASNLKPIQQLLCEYTVNSKGYITSVTPMGEVGMATAEYSSDTKAFGAYELAEDAVIIDLSSISNWLESGSSYDVNVIQKKEFSQLVNYMTYEVVVCDKNENGKYNFAVILSGGTGYTGYTPIAVYNTRGSVYDDIQGTTVDTLEVYINGNDETVSLKVAPGTNVTLNRGDVFLYKTDSNGYVDSIFKLFGSANESSYSWFMDNMTPANMGYKDVTSWNGVIKSIPVLSSMPDDWINTDATTKTGEVDLIYGVITDRRTDSVSIAQIESSSINSWEYVEESIVNKDLAEDYSISPYANVYIYDYSEGKVSNRVYTGSAGMIQKSMVPNSECIMDSNGFEVFTVRDSYGEYRELNFLFGKIVDGVITECFVILGSN